jgi:eukaryotic-like serine/threonine-protein kinase
MIGKTISHYRIVEKLGEGGMGVVYKARDTHLDRVVAIKVLPAERVADSDRKRRFIQEAKAASALNHPNIVTIYDIDQAGGVDFITMEYISGKPLDDLVTRKGLQLKMALKYAVQMADALAAAHAAGIVHRDLKPGNVMVTDSGLVKVLDFGLAKLIEQAATTVSEDAKTLASSAHPKTDDGVILGTVSYMSPEQAEGKPVDARSDIFSLGSVLYEMMTGQKAFQGETKLSTLTAILREQPKRAGEVVEGLPKEVERIISRCLRKEPSRRFQHMDDVKVELEELKEESDSGKLLVASVPQPSRRRSWLWTAGLLALLAIGATVLLLTRSTTKVPQVELTAVPLTSYPGMEDQPTFSPDGSQVAFVWDGEKQDNEDIYVKLISSGAWLRLTTDPARDYSPAWAPDGGSIAFVRELAGGRSAVFLVSPIGGPERKLAETSVAPEFSFFSLSSLAWSPDGSSLAIVDRNSPNEPSQIFLLSVETGERWKLTSPPPGAVGDFPRLFPRMGGLWLLDGSELTLAFVIFSFSNFQIN